MPLHLLGKKSWNVYNPANIARVRRDEAEAAVREAAEEQRMQELDSAHRLAILRGDVPPPLEEGEPDSATIPLARVSSDHHGVGRKRKRHGEDDTDFEMRLARERAAAGDRAARELAPNSHPAAPPSLVDSEGHISLFSEVETSRPCEKNEEVTQEAARKERQLKDQYQMRFVNAAGRDGQGLTDGGPWYASADGEASGALVPSKNVWGREDPGRKVREAARLNAGDPLAMMKKAAATVRKLEKERKKEVEEREKNMRILEKEKRRGRVRRKEADDGEDRRARGSSIDRRADKSVSRERSDRGHDRDHRRHRDRSEERQRPSRHRRDSPDGEGDPGRTERSRKHHEDRERHRHRSREQQRYSRDRRDSPARDGGTDRHERSHQDHHGGRHRHRSKERKGREEEDSSGRRRHRDEERYRHHSRNSSHSKERHRHGSEHR